eukprot:1156888-Pelagomonas_calceolata.AAC.8
MGMGEAACFIMLHILTWAFQARLRFCVLKCNQMIHTHPSVLSLLDLACPVCCTGQGTSRARAARASAPRPDEPSAPVVASLWTIWQRYRPPNESLVTLLYRNGVSRAGILEKQCNELKEHYFIKSGLINSSIEGSPLMHCLSYTYRSDGSRCAQTQLYVANIFVGNDKFVKSCRAAPRVTLLAAKMESMQHQRQDLQSTPTSFAPRPGEFLQCVWRMFAHTMHSKGVLSVHIRRACTCILRRMGAGTADISCETPCLRLHSKSSRVSLARLSTPFSFQVEDAQNQKAYCCPLACFTVHAVHHALSGINV